MTTTIITTFRHPSIDVSGPKEFWRALGYQPYSNTDVVGQISPEADALVLLGINATGANDQRALAWALNEKQRRSEEKTRTTAIAREAEAIKARIISRLSEQTQYAVRQQLRR